MKIITDSDNVCKVIDIIQCTLYRCIMWQTCNKIMYEVDTGYYCAHTVVILEENK